MNTWFVLAALTCFGSSLAQPSCAPGPFVADTFDIFNFTILRSYHDVSRQLSLYETPVGEIISLFDFNEGLLYANPPNDTCYVFRNPDSKNTMAALGLAKEKLEFTPHGETLHGYEHTNGVFTTRIILSDTCQINFLSFLVNNRVGAAYSFYNQRDFTNDDTQRVQDAKATFEAADCIKPWN